MKNIYNEIERLQQDEIKELEVEAAKYTEAYNNLKHDRASRRMGEGTLTTIEYFLYTIAAMCFISYIWIELEDVKSWANLINQERLSTLGAALMIATTIGWKALTAVVFVTSLTLGWLVSRIRNKNRVMHQQAELLNEMLNKLGTNLYKVKTAQAYFESLADGELKKEVNLVS